MARLPAALALASVAALLAGCAASSDEPAAAPKPTASASSSSSAAPEPSAAASATPSAAPSAIPSTESAAPSEPATPAAPIATPTGAPAPEVTEVVAVTPNPEWGVVRATVAQGASFTVNGSGYEPGQEIHISLGIDRTDSFVMDEQIALADAAGNYGVTITIAADLLPGAYGVLTYVADEGLGGPEFEATKRFAGIDVVAS